MNIPRDAKTEFCTICTERHCCRGICKDVNDYIVENAKYLQHPKPYEFKNGKLLIKTKKQWHTK